METKEELFKKKEYNEENGIEISTGESAQGKW
jgi:hypothetical protein